MLFYRLACYKPFYLVSCCLSCPVNKSFSPFISAGIYPISLRSGIGKCPLSYPHGLLHPTDSKHLHFQSDNRHNTALFHQIHFQYDNKLKVLLLLSVKPNCSSNLASVTDSILKLFNPVNMLSLIHANSL